MFLLVSCQNDNSALTDEDNNLVVTLDFVSLPNSFTYDYDSSEDFHIEHQWSVEFDIDNDGAVSEGDLSLSIFLHAQDSFAVQTINTTELNVYLMEYTVGGNEFWGGVAEIDLLVNDNSLIFIVPESAHEELKHISPGTQINVSIQFKDVNKGFIYDFYPAKGQFTNGVDVSYLTDIQDDLTLYSNFIYLLDYPGMNLGHIPNTDYKIVDLVSIEIEYQR